MNEEQKQRKETIAALLHQTAEDHHVAYSVSGIFLFLPLALYPRTDTQIASTGYHHLSTSTPAVQANQFGLLKKMILHACLKHPGIDPLRSIELQHRIKSIEFKAVPMRS